MFLRVPLFYHLLPMLLAPLSERHAVTKLTAVVLISAPETQRVVRSFPVLVDYAKRIHAAYFMDYDIWEEKVLQL